MTGPHQMAQLIVIPAMLVIVPDHSTQWRPRRIAIEKAALYFKGIFFRSCC